jgi:hypothetical protein
VRVACRGWIHGRRAHAPPWPPSLTDAAGKREGEGAVAGEEGEVRITLLRLDPWPPLERGLQGRRGRERAQEGEASAAGEE